ncbi:MAG: hypothetical protein ACK2T7_02480 [Anaerolineales bacterium]
MVEDSKESLNKAGDLIREGRTKSARAILLDILREDPEDAQAWFMLSYTIPDLERQISAVQRAVRLKPESEKARQRLVDLGGELPDENDLFDVPDPTSPITAELTPILPSAPGKVELPDTTEAVEVDTPTEELDPLDAFRNSMNTFKEFTLDARQEPDFTPRVDAIEKEVEEKEKAAKVFGIKRSYFLIGAAAVILVISSIALLSPNLRQAAISRQTTNTPASTRTLPPTLEPTATTRSQLPTNTPIPTEEPAATQPAEVGSLLKWGQLTRPTGILQDKLDTAAAQLIALVGAQIDPEFQSYAISEPELQGLIREISSLPQFEEQVENTHGFYQALGLADPEDDFEGLFANYWVDPNGTLAVPQDQSIANYGYDFTDYQKYSYAQGTVQLLRYAQFPDSPLYQLSFPCFLPSEKCDIWNAVIKGEAAFTADQWAAENMSSTALQNIANTNAKFTFTPISPPATDLMDTLIESPYQIGYNFAQEVYKADGWAGLERIYSDPPKSTEQLLHPEKYIAGEEPIGVIGDDLGSILDEEWEPLFKGPIGEWKTYLMLTHSLNPYLQLDPQTAQRVAAGWDGDLTQIYKTSSGRVVLLFHWLWETEGEQSQFELAIRAHASRMVGGLEAKINGTDCEKSTYQTSCIIASGLETIWLLAPDVDTAAIVLENYSPISSQ